MGPSQGRFSQVPSARYLAKLTGSPLEQVGLTTARPPWSTVPLAALAGRPFEPAKRSALHARHRELRANVRWAGDWRRSYDYGDPQAEALAVHKSAGLIDVSSLGKLLVSGPHAAELLDRLYPNRMSNLAAGRIRYGVMLSESGRITDDGTVCRLDEQSFYVTTTSAGAAGVAQQMTWWATAWKLDAQVTDLTQGVAAMNLAGPHARALLSELTTLDCSAESFRYLDARNAVIAGVPALVLRIGFTGELGYEIHCPAPQAPALWEAILSSGDVTAFGLEAQRVLRLQKQHVIVGQDTDSEATPYSVGMDWLVQLDEGRDFIGRWALEQRAGREPPTKLVGFTVPSGAVMTEGAVVLRDGAASDCQVTSARWSPQLQASIGLATVPAELAADGAEIQISYAGVTHAATVTTRPFYDPDGEVVRA
jgi:sarcosine oxidase subunit alpha